VLACQQKCNVRLWLACVPTQHRPKEAAALWESLAQNHPFIDGNKRVAFAATYTFLAINGMRIAADAKAAIASCGKTAAPRLPSPNMFASAQILTSFKRMCGRYRRTTRVFLTKTAKGQFVLKPGSGSV